MKINDIERMRITSWWFVGIWTNSPTVSLQVSGNFIAGATSNSIDWVYSSIAWGYSNSVDWSQSFIAWWVSNTIFSWSLRSSIAWWTQNKLTWNYSFIAWWYYNSISWNNSFVAGKFAETNYDNTFIWNDHGGIGMEFSATKANTFLIHATNWVGINTNNPSTNLDINGNLRIRDVTNDNNLTGILAIDNSGVVYSVDKNSFADTNNYITWIYFSWINDTLYVYITWMESVTWYIPNYWSRNATSWYLYPKTITDKIWINTNNPQVNLDVNWRFWVQYWQHINNISNAIDWPYDSGSLVTEKGIYDRTVLSYKWKKFFFGNNLYLWGFEDTWIWTKRNLWRNFILSFYVSDTICWEQFNMSKIYITYWTDLINPWMYTKLVPTNEFTDYRPVCINNQNFIRKIEIIDNNTTRYRYHNPSWMPFMWNIGEKIMIRWNEYNGNNWYFTITDLDTDLYGWVEVTNSNSENDEIVEDMYKIWDIFKPLEIESIIDRWSNIWRYNFENGNTVDSTIVTGDFIEILYANNSTNNMTWWSQRWWVITAIDQSKTWIEIENFTWVEETNSPAIWILKKKLDIDTRITPNLNVTNMIVVEPKTNAEFMANYIISDYTEQNSNFSIDSRCSTPWDENCWNVIILLGPKYDFIDRNNSNNSIQQQIYYDSNIDMWLPITNFLWWIKNNIRSIWYWCESIWNDNYCPIFANDYTVIASWDSLATLYLNLPTAVWRTWQVFVIKAAGTWAWITIQNYWSETIDRVHDFTFSAEYETITVQSDWSNRWRIN
jgi:hypothetical protein